MDSYWTVISNTMSVYEESYSFDDNMTLTDAELIEVEELIKNQLKETYNVDEYHIVGYDEFLHYIVRVHKNFDKYDLYPYEEHRYCVWSRLFIWFLLPPLKIEFKNVETHYDLYFRF